MCVCMQIAVFGERGVFTALSSQFFRVRHKSNCYAKSQCCNFSFLCRVPALFFFKVGHSPPSSYVLDINFYYEILKSSVELNGSCFSYKCFFFKEKKSRALYYLEIENSIIVISFFLEMSIQG